jgi:NAD(P)-dependent dehydrogenase (short-subunit alcohol dehydrogenase family)
MQYVRVVVSLAKPPGIEGVPTVPDSINGKIAIVTGASKGLGRAIAASLVEAGACVALLARSQGELQALAEELGDSTHPFPCDLRSPESIRAGIAAIAAHFGAIDILINNAMACLLNPIHTIPEQDARCEVETNLLGPILTIREVVPHMLKQGQGDIINVSSESVAMPFPYLSVYAATKAGLEGLSAALRSELGYQGIRVGTFRSGFMAESASAALWSEENKAGFYEALRKTGLDHFSGAGVPVRVQADMLVSMLTLPRSANVDHMTVRSAR